MLREKFQPEGQYPRKEAVSFITNATCCYVCTVYTQNRITGVSGVKDLGRKSPRSGTLAPLLLRVALPTWQPQYAAWWVPSPGCFMKGCLVRVASSRNGAKTIPDRPRSVTEKEGQDVTE